MGLVRKELEKKDDSKENKDTEQAEAEKPVASRTPSPSRTVEAMNRSAVKAAVEAQSHHATRQIAAEQVRHWVVMNREQLHLCLLLKFTVLQVEDDFLL